MGAQGIHRRKKWRKLPPVPDLPPEDARHLLGWFRWGAFTPSGTVERSGFFWRQLRRNGTEGAWSFIDQARWIFVSLIGAMVAVALFVRFGT